MPDLITESDGRRRRSIRTRRKILQAARAVFLSNGYRETNFNDISRHAGVGYGTVYGHFSSKEALLRALIDEVINKINRAVYIDYNPSHHSDVVELVYRQVHGALQLATENREELKIVYDALAHSQPTRDYWNSIIDHLIKRTMAEFAYSQEHKLAKPLNKRIVAKAIVYMTREFLWDVVWELETDIVQISRNLVDLYIDGVYWDDPNDTPSSSP